MSRKFDIPVAHIDEPDAVGDLLATLRQIHGPAYEFALRTWEGETRLSAPKDKTIYRFVMRTERAALRLHPGDLVRGLPGAPGGVGRIQMAKQEALWPGDVITTGPEMGDGLVTGSGVCFEITAETTAYPAPKAAFLRHLPDHPGGCAAYPNAFRREVLPPDKEAANAASKRGHNRVNEHTLDMRPDRDPLPSRHHHGQVADATGPINHTETALVLPRSIYGLPLPNGTEEGRAVIYRDPLNKKASDAFIVPVRPGSLVVTPSTGERLYGHAFENAFAMLVAVPGFVAPYVMIPD
ncbi:MAG: hypothetical protein O3B73_18170 [bacterium]|nr:hypothetical protein [bacterium]